MRVRGSDHSSDFDVAVLGYDRDQVERYLNNLMQRVDEAAEAFTLAIALQNQLNEARTEIKRLRQATRQLPDGRGLGDRITEVFQAAERQAAAICAQAQRDAEAIRASARADAAPAGEQPDPAHSTWSSQRR